MEKKLSRRTFLKLTGSGAAAAAVLTGCGPLARYVVRHPYTDMPEYNQTGHSTYYATTCRECPAACGLVVRTMEGRALKVEGNPNHLVNRGRVCSRGLASLQGLYNPDRIQGPRKQAQRGSGKLDTIEWSAALDVVKNALQTTPPDGIAFLLGQTPDHFHDLVTDLTQVLGAPAPLRYGALGMLEGRFTLKQAAQAALGMATLPYFDLARADMTFAFGADFLGAWVSPVYYGRAYGQMRQGKPNQRGYLVVFDPHQSLTAGNADEWIPINPGSEALLAQTLGRLVAEIRKETAPAALSPKNLPAASQASGLPESEILRLANLFASADHPLAIPGGMTLGQANGMAAAQSILLLNALVHNLSQPGGMSLSAALDQIKSMTDLKDLVNRMQQGQVKVLFIHGQNPVFELPAALGFAQALAKVPQVVSFASFVDETALQADYILPDHTPLESWGYSMVIAGADRPAVSASQPVVVPLYHTQAAVDVLLEAVRLVGGDLAAKLNFRDEVDYIQQKLPSLFGRGGVIDATEVKTFWAQWLQNGGWWLSQPSLPPTDEKTAFAQKISLVPAAQPPSPDALRLVTYATMLGDGSLANRSWLQETPNPLTTAMWNSWIEIHPDTAARLGIKDDDIVEVTSSAGKVEAIAYLFPALRPDTVAIPFGQGHTALGRWAKDRGCNPANLLEMKLNDAGDLAYGDTWVTLKPTGKTKQLARAENRLGIYGDH